MWKKIELLYNRIEKLDKKRDYAIQIGDQAGAKAIMLLINKLQEEVSKMENQL